LGFTPRELSARIFVENDAEIEVFHQKKTVSGPSNQNSLDTTFRLELPPAALKGATKYWIELAECSVLPAGTVGTVRVPASPGVNAEFQARQTGVVKVVFVPISHDGRVPDTTEPTLKKYMQEIEKLYPTVAVEGSIRSAVNSNQSGVGVDLGYTLDQITQQRADDGAPDDVYYYGLIDPASSVNQYCQGGCVTGVGWVPEASGWWAIDHRAAVGVGFGTWGVGTFAHELGHNHGRHHAPCGNPDGPDSNYPYSNAAIGSWGYDRIEKALVEPTGHRDFMSYCDPTWVSNYTFQNLVNRIAAVNGAPSFQVAPPPLGPATEWYRMLVTPSGARWTSSVQGPGAPSNNSEPGFVYDAAGNILATVNVYRMNMSDGGGYMLYVPAPKSGWASVGAQGGPVLSY
jgi:hypothetical protein